MLIKFGDFEFYEINIIMLPRHSARQNINGNNKEICGADFDFYHVFCKKKNGVQQTQVHSLSEVLCDIAWFSIELILC